MIDDHQKQAWSGNERHEYQRTISDVESAFNRALAEHEIREKANVEKIIHELKRDIVPDGDLRPHKDYHQAKIDAAVAEKNFWDSLKLEVAKTGVKGLWILVVTVVGLAYIGVMVKLGLRPLP